MTLAHDYEEHGEPRLDAGSQQSATLLPRISIQAFCETRDVMEALEEARADRRASRTQMSVQMGGVAAAIDLYRESPTPDIVVLESMAGGQRLLDDLERLADVCDAETQVIIIGHANDVMLYRQLLARGVSEYLVAPVGPVDAIAAMCRLYAQEGEQHTGRSIAVIGAKGGVGASTVAHNFGWAMSQDMLKNVAIADLDLPFGTAGLDFNQDPSQGIADAIFAGDRLDESLIDKLLWKCTDRLSLFAAPATLDRDYDLEFEAVEPVIDLVRSLVPHIILDMPHQWNAWMRQTLMAADDIIIVAAPDLGNLRNAKNLVDLLTTHRRNDRQPFLVLNQVGVPKRPEIAPREFADALNLELAAEIAFEPQLFGTAANNGQMISEAQTSAKAAEAFRDLARAIAGQSEAPRGANTLIAQLMSRLKMMKDKK
ncbi:MAG: AAA family ATPase [Rhodobiaceae bacterium]|nr:AAA family ATPase [Rhodobiaceae bacterium]MCC0013929.1 AAA family ATPase [Rhodobiaceae bacterium]MCC0017937.1 AAA family ATPase [Rhodobiaceae bacterium]MCC0062111.1 AAA family ATPase [Rhodobiaceae bacterium]